MLGVFILSTKSLQDGTEVLIYFQSEFVYSFERTTVLILVRSCAMQPLSGKLYTYFSLKVSLRIL